MHIWFALDVAQSLETNGPQLSRSAGVSIGPSRFFWAGLMEVREDAEAPPELRAPVRIRQDVLHCNPGMRFS